MNPMKNQKGCSIIAAVFIIVILAFMGVMFLTMVNTASFTSVNDLQSAQALNVAESGIEYALNQFWTGTSCNSLGYTNVALGAGSFTTTGTLYNPAAPATVSVVVNAGDAAISVTSVNGYAPHGRIRIETEEILYGALDIPGNRFINVQRGAAGTTAAGHAINRPVYQNECLIQSIGTVGNAKRTIQKAVVGMSVRQGSFTKRTAGMGAQSITGIGFQPKAVIFFWTRQTAQGFINSGPGALTGINAGFGSATGPANEMAVSTTGVDNSANSDDGRRRSATNQIIFLSAGGPPTLQAQASLTSLDADGFTLNWTTNDANAYIIHYIALGGDVTNAQASTFNLSTAAGNQAVAGVGFQPDFVIFWWSFTEAVDTNAAGGELGLGFAKSVTARGALVNASRDNIANNLQKRWQQRNNAAILVLNPGTSPPASYAVADFVSLDANGFTVNKTTAPAAATPIFYLALKGGRYNVGSFNQRNGAGAQAIVGVGFEPQEIMLASFNLVALGAPYTPVGGGAISIGAAQSTMATRGGIWYQDRDIDRSVADMYTSTANALTLAFVPNTVNAQANFTSFDTDGFTLNWTTADATARQILYWAVGPNVNQFQIDWMEIYP